MDTKKNTTQDQDLQRLQRRELLSLAYDLHRDLDCEVHIFVVVGFFDEREGASSKKQERQRVVSERVVGSEYTEGKKKIYERTKTHSLSG